MKLSCKSILFSLLFFTFQSFIFAQNQPNFNFNFETIDTETKKPKGWYFGNTSGYIVRIDNKTVQDGNSSIMITPDPKIENKNFGTCFQSIPAKYDGLKVTLKGYLKTKDVTNGFAGLWMRIDTENRANMKFDNMQKQNIQGTNDWTEYTITLALPDDATKINVGALNTGEGIVWVDNFSVTIDGTPIEEAKKVMMPAELDTEFNEGSNIEITNLDNQQIDNLMILGKVWGFVKYHHPAIATGQHNMDAELFRIMPQVLAATNGKTRDKALAKWIQSFGKIAKCTNCVSKKLRDVYSMPDNSWINDNTLHKSLTSQLNLIYDNRSRIKKHYYIGMAPGIGNPIFKNENSYGKMLNPDAGYRILALYRYWNIIEYFFPYKDVIGKDWESVMRKFIPEFIEANDEKSYRMVALRLIENIHDTHANIWGRDPVLTKVYGTYFAPFETNFIQNNAVITKFRNDNIPKETGLMLGDIITAIDGKQVSDIVKEQLPLTPASNLPTKMRNISNFLLRGTTENTTITIDRNGETFTKTITRYNKENIRGLSNKKKEPYYRLLKEDIGYIHLGRIKSSDLGTIFKDFENTKGLVIDLRTYPSEFVVFSLGHYLMPKPKAFVKFTAGNINTPGAFTWTDKIKVGDNNKDYYKGKVTILINETTQSQAEYTTMAFRAAPNVTVIGSTTAAADGNVSGFHLPGKIYTMISGIGVFYPDGTPTQRVGIVPDIELHPTIEGIKAGKDELLDKAIEVIEKQ